MDWLHRGDACSDEEVRRGLARWVPEYSRANDEARLPESIENGRK
jgi:hypothetical protein